MKYKSDDFESQQNFKSTGRTNQMILNLNKTLNRQDAVIKHGLAICPPLVAQEFTIPPDTSFPCSIGFDFLSHSICSPSFESTSVMTAISVDKTSDSFVNSFHPGTLIVSFVKFIPAITMEIPVCKVPAIHTPILKQKSAIAVSFVRAKGTLVHIAVLVLVNAASMSTIKNKRTFIAVAIGSPQNAMAVPVTEHGLPRVSLTAARKNIS
jgi:hypothetical protein